jgi:hypothetical protein
MQLEPGPPLDEVEEQVRAATAKYHSSELGLLENLLNCYISGITRIGTFTRTENNRLQQVHLFLTIRSFNSLRWAYHLLKSGYYSQAAMLVRSAYEDWLVCKDSEKCAFTVDALLTGVPKLGEGKLTYTEMARRVDPGYENVWKNDYGSLSEYGSHPRMRAVAILIDPGTKTLRFGGHYDRVLFVATCDVLLNILILMITEFLPKLLGRERYQPWVAQTDPFIRQAMTWRAEIKRRVEAGEDV